MAEENKIVTLNVKGKYGITHVPFELLRDLGNNKYLLYSNGRICTGIRGATGIWSLIKIADLVDFEAKGEEASVNCPEVV